MTWFPPGVPTTTVYGPNPVAGRTSRIIRNVTEHFAIGDALLDGSLVVDISRDSVLLFRHGRQQLIRTFEHSLDLSHNPFENFERTRRSATTFASNEAESLGTPTEILSVLTARHAAAYQAIPAVPNNVVPRRRTADPMDDPRLKLLRANAAARLPKEE